jgi:biopolymer transport protein ExbB/TolQ
VLFTLGAAIVALACVLASGRRLAWAVAPIALEPRMVLDALAGEQADALLRALSAVVASDDRMSWERDLLTAFDEGIERQRDALVNEQLLELEGRLVRFSRVPRVCASIATSAGLLFGSLALLQGLGAPEGGDAAVANAALGSALGAVSLGIAATAFCVAVHVRTGRLVAQRRAAIDDLVTRLQRLRSDRPS